MSNVLTDAEAKAHLAAHLRQLVDARQISQAKLAKEIDVSPMTVNYWLQGSRMAGAGPLARLAEFFEVSTDFLLSKPSRKKTRHSA